MNTRPNQPEDAPAQEPAFAGGASRASGAANTPGVPGPFDEPMMDRALELARQAGARGEVPVGAVVFETATGRVLGEGSNQRERGASAPGAPCAPDPAQAVAPGGGDPLGHAELLAIAAAARRLGDWRLNACTLVVTLEPCPMCAGAIVNARLGRLVFGCRDPKAGACGSLMRLTEDPRLNHRVRPIEGVRADACAELLRSFFRGLRGAG